MVHAKAVRVQILGIFLLVVILWLCIGGRVEAEEEADFTCVEVSTFTYNGVEYPYYYIGSYETNVNGRIYNHIFKVPLYGFRCADRFYFFSKEYNIRNYYLGEDYLGSYEFGYNADYELYWQSITQGSLYGCSLPDSGAYVSGVHNAFIEYFASDDFVEYEKVPIWRAADAEPDIYLRDFHAEIENDSVVASWNGVNQGILKPSLRGINSFENTYVRLTFALCSSDDALEPVYISYPNGILGSTPYKISDNGFVVALSELEIPDSYILWFVQATPYWYENDDLAGDLKIGSCSKVYFNEDGSYSHTETKAPHVSYDQEEPEKSIWDSITDFTTNIGDQITGALAAAFIPDSEELLDLVEEMNTWFGDRFGFIWYPFDSAVEIAAALTTGEANSMFTVPALKLNMFGGITLWEEFQTDMDALGILKYVRYFTSMVLAISTVRLAMFKFDEWIGGKKS